MHRAVLIGLALVVTGFVFARDLEAATPAAIQIIGSTEMAEGTVEPFFARVTYTNASNTVVTATWTAPGTSAQNARLFNFAAPEVTVDATRTLLVSYTEAAVTVTNSFNVTVKDVPWTSAGALEAMRHETERRLRSRAGFSVDAATGAHILETRVIGVRATTDLNLDFTFNSRFTSRDGPLGPGWRHTFDLRLSGNPTNVLVLHEGPEFETRFRHLETISGIARYVPLERANRNDRLTRDNNSGGAYNLILC